MICDEIFVTSSGEMKLDKAMHTIRKNGRKDFLLLYVCDGICEFVLNGNKSIAKKEMLFFIIRTRHRITIFRQNRSPIIFGFISAAIGVMSCSICCLSVIREYSNRRIPQK